MRIPKIFVLLVIFAVWTTSPGVAQSGERMDSIIDQVDVSAGEAAYLAAASAEIVDPEADNEEALDALTQRGLDPGRVSPDEAVTLGEFSYMLMLAHDLGGGFMYTLFPGPRYSFRELSFQRVIRGGGDPDHDLSGTRAIRLTGRVVSLAEDG